MLLHDAIDAIRDDLIALRHDIHQHPEPGFEEVRTQAAIRAQLEAVGLSPRDCAGTGLVVDIGSGDGPTIALRADMDCLRMTEGNHHLPYRSAHEGLAHMCGHDGHTATLVGVGRLLAPLADQLNGRVRLLFQPAEEGPGGAPKMIEEGCLDGVDEVYGMHNWPGAPLGALRTIEGPCMATVAEFKLTVHGRGTHASQPHAGADAIVAGAAIVQSLQTIIARNVHYLESAVVSVTTFHAGEAFNVLPDTAVLGGTVRALSDEAAALIESRIGALAEGIAAAHGCRAELVYTPMYPVVVNAPKPTQHLVRVASELFGADAVNSDSLPMLGAEDFAYFLQHRPGCFFFLGSAEDGRSNSLCHATDYDFNDNLIAPGVALWFRLVEDRLGQSLRDR
jgi:amidohydrolase